MDNYGGSADQLVIMQMQIVTYNRPAKLGSDTKRGVSYRYWESGCYSDVMIADTVAATVTCPPAFLGYCRNSDSGTVHVSGWC